jgi:hypothetical protein
LFLARVAQLAEDDAIAMLRSDVRFCQLGRAIPNGLAFTVWEDRFDLNVREGAVAAVPGIVDALVQRCPVTLHVLSTWETIVQLERAQPSSNEKSRVLASIREALTAQSMLESVLSQKVAAIGFRAMHDEETRAVLDRVMPSFRPEVREFLAE